MLQLEREQLQDLIRCSLLPFIEASYHLLSLLPFIES